MKAGAHRQGWRFLPAAVLGVISWLVFERSGPLLIGHHINPVAACGALGLALAGMTFAVDSLRLTGRVLGWLKARTPTGLKGTAGWLTSFKDISHDLVREGWGPYWGAYEGREIIADFESNAFCLGPAGSGKSTGMVQTNALAIRDSKVLFDFKSDLAPVLAGTLKARGETVKTLNLGGLFADRVGPSDEYNPLNLIADDFWRPGGLLDVVDDVTEMCLQLDPEPKTDKGENGYFRSGQRNLESFAIHACTLISGYQATMGDVSQMLNDRESLLLHARWIAGRLEVEGEEGEGEAECEREPVYAAFPLLESPWVERHAPEDVENYGEHLRGLASGIVDLLETRESRTAESFLTGARQALAPFHITSRALKKMRRSTFRFADLKEGESQTTVFIMLDANKIQAQAPVLGLLQFCMQTELKRHENKHRPVYVLVDEATNIPWSNLGSLLTWARGYGLRLLFFFQNFTAFREAHGEAALQILLSECEIRHFLPGQRNPETLKMIEESILGQQSLIVQGHRGDKESGFGVNGVDYREDGRPLMTADEIRRTNKTILIIRKNKPWLVDTPSIAAIDPWRSQVAINPFHGKPYLKPIKLRIKRGRRRANGWLRFLARR